MLKMYYNLPNGKSFAHVSRSCTSTLCAHALKNFWPEKYEEFIKQTEYKHSPQRWMIENWSNRLVPHCLVMVRNPIERLNSLICRNHYDHKIVDAVLSACDRKAQMDRNISKNISLIRFHHIAPISWIADNDSVFCLFPNVKKACEILEMQYYPEIHENILKNERQNHVDDHWETLLKDSIGIYEALSLIHDQDS